MVGPFDIGVLLGITIGFHTLRLLMMQLLFFLGGEKHQHDYTEMWLFFIAF